MPLKDEYVTNPEVVAFTEWFVTQLTSRELIHHYQTPDGETHTYNGLASALEQYDWPFNVTFPGAAAVSRGRSFDENTVVLDRLRRELLSALRFDPVDDESTTGWSIAVMQWGGVLAHNGAWLNANCQGLTDVLNNTKTLLAQNNDGAFVARFNAGMSKIYSLILDQFIIYDSRVAASLAWFVAKWCHLKGKNEIPDLLYLRCLRPKEAVDALTHKNRNPTCLHYSWGWVNTRQQHVRWNLRASWLLELALLNSQGTAFHGTTNPLRALEAALFMWGYDLANLALCDQPGADDPNHEEAWPNQPGQAPDSARVAHLVTLDSDNKQGDVEWRDGRTHGGGLAVNFSWRVTTSEDAITIRKADGSIETFAFSETFRILHELFDEFGYDFFPLANNVQRLHAGSERHGLGNAILSSRPGPVNLAHAQSASQLGVVLETLGLLEWNGVTRGIQWRISKEIPSTIDELRLEISPN